MCDAASSAVWYRRQRSSDAEFPERLRVPLQILECVVKTVLLEERIQLKPEIERRLTAEAAAQGVSVEVYLTSLIEGGTTPLDPEAMTPEQFEADMDLLAEGSEQLPILPADAFSRESIYADHD